MRDTLAQLAPYLEAEVATFVHDSGVPGVAAAAVMRGEMPWTFAYGSAEVGTAHPLEATTPMRVGSLTKPFTAATILRLRDGGRLSLDDPVVEHLPEFARVTRGAGSTPDAVRLRDLVTHRAGLPGEVHALDEAADRYPTIEEILAGLGDVGLLHPPGAAMRYSNLGYQLLGEVVARRTGTTYERACADLVLGPLALTRTRFDTPDGAARGHRARAFTDDVRPAPERRKRTNADGGLWSTADDQARWITAHVGDATYDEMHGPIGGSDDGGGPGQGLGWFRERRDARTLVYHQGSTPGFAARIALSPTLGGGAVVLANGEASVVDVLGRIVDLVLDAAEGAVPSEPPPALPDPPVARPYPSAWDDLVGFYAWPGSAMLFRLEVRSGQLRLVDLESSDRAVPLEPARDGEFVATAGGWSGERVVVHRATDGRVRGLSLGGWSLHRLVEAGT